MYIQVRLLKGFPQPLWYQVPNNAQEQYTIGIIVNAPIRTQIVPALVINVQPNKPNVSFAIREIGSVEPFPHDHHYYKYLESVCDYYCVEKIQLIKRIHQFLQQKETKENSLIVSKVSDIKTFTDVTLTHEQQAVVDFLNPYITAPEYVPTLLHGVTGSGKTEIYKKLIETAFADGKTVVLLAPEVSLAMQLENVLHNQLSHIPIATFHSATTIKQKKIVWQRLLKGQPLLLIGVHLPILMPIANLGFIIVDEEHEVGYQEKKHPKINSKEAALLRARVAQIPILLGSATPSLSSLYNVKRKGWYFFQLKERFSGAFPTIKIVLLAQNRNRPHFWITRELQQAIRQRLYNKEQSIIFLNRRGYSFFVQCSSCSFIFSCDACSVSLTLHNDGMLACHYCGFTKAMPLSCSECKAPEKKLIKKGIGTQQVVTILQKLFPTARIGRADLDVSSKKKLWQQTVHDFESGNIDILVGTQTIAKGFHFPNVTLVGVLWADLNLHFPRYNATEVTLQQLIQVAGRAGRACSKSDVIVQTMSDHPVFKYLNEIDYLNFYKKEIQNRAEVSYPPCSRFAEIELKYSDERVIEKESMALASILMKKAKESKDNIVILGPAKPPVNKIKHNHVRKIYCKGSNIVGIAHLFKQINQKSYQSSIFFTPNPQT